MLDFVSCESEETESTVATVFLFLFATFILADIVLSSRALNAALGGSQ